MNKTRYSLTIQDIEDMSSEEVVMLLDDEISYAMRWVKLYELLDTPCPIESEFEGENYLV